MGLVKGASNHCYHPRIQVTQRIHKHPTAADPSDRGRMHPMNDRWHIYRLGKPLKEIRVCSINSMD